MNSVLRNIQFIGKSPFSNSLSKYIDTKVYLRGNLYNTHSNFFVFSQKTPFETLRSSPVSSHSAHPGNTRLKSPPVLIAYQDPIECSTRRTVVHHRVDLTVCIVTEAIASSGNGRRVVNSHSELDIKSIGGGRVDGDVPA